MQTYIDCYPCFLRQAIEAAQMVSTTPTQKQDIIHHTLELLKHIPEGATPSEIGAQVHQIIREVLGVDDPYQGVKRDATTKALALLPELRMILDNAEDTLSTALRLSIAGNIMDFGPNPDYDLWEVVMRVLHQPPAIDATDALRQQLAEADYVLFIGDNAGETVFDRLLIETLAKPVTYVVRGGPVINDATMADALEVGFDQLAEIIDTGTRIPGIVLSQCSPDFQVQFKNAPLILAKGMGNYETLSQEYGPIIFLLQVKCPVIARDIGAPMGSTVIKAPGEHSESKTR